MNKKSSRKSPVERMLTRLHVGCVNLQHHPQLYAAVLAYLIVICLVANAVMQPATGDLFAVLAHNINRALLPVYAIAGLLILIVLFGVPKGVIKASRALARAGIVNAVGEAPMLLSMRHSQKNRKLLQYEFDANGLPLSYWQDHQAEIEAALNLSIAAIRTSRGKHRIWIDAVPAIDAIPDFIEFDSSLMPTKESQLALGEGLLGQIITDINKIPHILIGGSTGSGKTLLLKLLLVQLILKGAMIYIADFKGGVDYPAHWAESCNIITDECDLDGALASLVFELEHRKELFKKHDCSNITVYNSKFPNDVLPRIIFACDEIAEILDKTGASKERKNQIEQVESYLSKIARQGRAFGIHLILATQRPDANILPGQIKNNMDCRICGRADQVLSQIILDSTIAADEISEAVQGRFITRAGDVFQSYYFDENEMEEIFNEKK